MHNPSEPGSRLEEIINKTRDTMTVERVYGDPLERDGLTIIPAARVSGGLGGGGGGHVDDGQSDGGHGFGFGLKARPVGVYVIKDGEVTWRPAIDVTRIVLATLSLAAGLLLTRAWRRRESNP